MAVVFQWRGDVSNVEVNVLHAEAFETRVHDDWDWLEQVQAHSLGWVAARNDVGDALLGFINVPWDGGVHAWIQDTMVATPVRRRGIGKRLVEIAVEEARRAGCEWIHVDFEAGLRAFYLAACRFERTDAGVIRL
jgi:GNAT superfamily N-acetyltransferase